MPAILLCGCDVLHALVACFVVGSKPVADGVEDVRRTVALHTDCDDLVPSVNAGLRIGGKSTHLIRQLEVVDVE